LSGGRGFWVLAGAFLVLALLVVVGLSVGVYPVSLRDVLGFLVGAGPGGAVGEALRVRLGRVVAAVLVGCGLSVSGVVLQVVLRNPLASPFTLGVSQAAGFGAAAVIILLGAGASGFAGVMPYVVPLSAFVSALAALVFVYVLASRRGLSPSAVVLAGVAVGFLFQALTMLVEFMAPNEVLVSAALFWLFGDVGRASLLEDAIMAAVVVPVVVVFALLWMELDALGLGDDVAASMGVEPGRVRGLVLVLSSLVTAVSVAFVGVVGFVGLLAPHLARLVSGEASSRLLVPLSGLLGASLLLGADVVGRLMVYPDTLPVGVTAALIGAPMLVALLARGRLLGDGGHDGAVC